MVMNLEQQKHLYALLDASVKMHFMLLKISKVPTDGHSVIPDSVGDDIPCEYCGIINQAEYDLSDIYADIVYDKFIRPTEDRAMSRENLTGLPALEAE